MDGYGCVYRAAHVEKYSEDDMYSFLQWIDLHANRGGNVHIDVHGVENLPEKNGFMFFPNHRDCTMFWPLLKRVRDRFRLLQRKKLVIFLF